MRLFIAAILFMGALRFALTLATPDQVAKYASMSVVILIGAVYFSLTTRTHKDRLKAAFLLILPYMTVEVLALGYTWISGRPTIFHAAEYNLGTSIAVHTLGHLVGGLTWEPLMTFVLMEAVWGIAAVTGRTSRSL
ncbi:MAG TPA: hypothetical protein VFY29_13620 [Terriglobia bacterium]|nr:hypothetical protein [Terriglobia bacterium]